MSATNIYKQLQRLLGPGPVQSGTVTAVTDGIATVTLTGGGRIQARGAAEVGDRVYVQAGVIQGPAPALPTASIEV